jgi:hypothetical protein
MHSKTWTRNSFPALSFAIAIALAALSACGGGSAAQSASKSQTIGAPPISSPAVQPPQSHIAVLPSIASIAVNGEFQFTAHLLTNGNSTAVSWTVSGDGCAGASCGTIDAAGHYVAPAAIPSPLSITVTATSTADSTQLGRASVSIVSSAAGSFVPTGSMTKARAGYTATLLLDGRVLIAGGDKIGSAELYDPGTGTFSRTGAMRLARTGHRATRLMNGKVRITGPASTTSAELYDPATGQFAPAGGMLAPVQDLPSAVLLAGGLVLVAGEGGAELYDPATDLFVRTGPYAAAGSFYLTATALGDGRALLVGDSYARIYDPARDVFSATGPLVVSSPWDYGGSGDYGDTIFFSDYFTATLLNTGQVLIAGGSTTDHLMNAAMLYDPVTNAFTATSRMYSSRGRHAAVRLADGRILIVGGDTERCSSDACDSAGSLAGAELYDPSSGTFSLASNMHVPRTSPTATLLNNGDVLITGGVQYCETYRWCGDLASAELYHPAQ